MSTHLHCTIAQHFTALTSSSSDGAGDMLIGWHPEGVDFISYGNERLGLSRKDVVVDETRISRKGSSQAEDIVACGLQSQWC